MSGPDMMEEARRALGYSPGAASASSSPSLFHFLHSCVNCISRSLLCSHLLLALALRDDALDLIEPTIGAGYLLDDIAADLASTAALTGLGGSSLHTLAQSRAVIVQARLVRCALACNGSLLSVGKGRGIRHGSVLQGPGTPEDGFTRAEAIGTCLGV